LLHHCEAVEILGIKFQICEFDRYKSKKKFIAQNIAGDNHANFTGVSKHRVIILTEHS
jgi:uncharacterized protein YigE (DUF2233 family)